MTAVVCIENRQKFATRSLCPGISCRRASTVFFVDYANTWVAICETLRDACCGIRGAVVDDDHFIGLGERLIEDGGQRFLDEALRVVRADDYAHHRRFSVFPSR